MGFVVQVAEEKAASDKTARDKEEAKVGAYTPHPLPQPCSPKLLYAIATTLLEMP